MGPEQIRIHGPGPENAKIPRRLELSRDFIWVFLGLAAFLAAAQFYLNPEAIQRTAVGRNLDGAIDDIWNISYGLAGLLIMYGVIRGKGRAELIGQMFFTAGVIPNILAILISVGGGPSFWTVLTAGVASMARMYYLWQTTPRKR